MHVTVDDVNFCGGLECVYVKYKSHASTAVVMDGTLGTGTFKPEKNLVFFQDKKSRSP